MWAKISLTSCYTIRYHKLLGCNSYHIGIIYTFGRSTNGKGEDCSPPRMFSQRNNPYCDYDWVVHKINIQKKWRLRSTQSPRINPTAYSLVVICLSLQMYKIFIRTHLSKIGWSWTVIVKIRLYSAFFHTLLSHVSLKTLLLSDPRNLTGLSGFIWPDGSDFKKLLRLTI